MQLPHNDSSVHGSSSPPRLQLPLHALFHVTSTAGPYIFLLFAELSRFERQQARLDTTGPLGALLPLVVLRAKHP